MTQNFWKSFPEIKINVKKIKQNKKPADAEGFSFSLNCKGSMISQLILSKLIIQ